MELNKYIDHTLLKADATYEMIDKLCEEAKKYNFFSVCVNGCHVKRCYNNLKGTNVKVCTVVGFPLGAMTTESKVFETEDAIKNGADEIDMVINIGAVKSNDFDLVFNDIKALVDVTRGKALLKVILETCLLTDEEIEKVSKLCVDAKAEFVKTSTGFSTAGSNEKVVTIMKNAVKDNAKVKASGGIRDKATAIRMIELGAERLGVSAGVSIVTE
ncbi:MAG: deoxyribose-phosphate aldolase [Peptoniphilaceae bacterium]|uniref:deoxyribose-phosphate aldolase n=1 Tax=Parvimonas sp. TaxID=1944660 RepID=UPI0025E4D37F|nr:deoxyribose-phosphate aldolase [Parvimonas sp.]MCI5996891.1 deoxyribose-phosphate aldolase [Parvimonas sp.]MDD7764711.1 deoxyribose-phosphate aldolase [Peptoniphilaceae bacterium]MDY3051440.1 deoxyribose-phosphate aldolase [Parvimonas sp.]